MVGKRRYGVMRRRRYLQATAAVVSGGMAGCSELGMSDSSTPTDTETPTPTPTATEEPTATPREDPPTVDPALWLKLIPREYMTNQGKYSEATQFSRVDWQWYVANRDMSPEWAPAEDESWTFAPVPGNAKRVPSADILKTPHFGSYTAAFGVEARVFRFPDLGPEMKRQTGLAAEEGNREQARVVEEVVTYARPSMTIFIGADTAAVHEVLADHKKTEYDNAAVTAYIGGGDWKSQNILVSEEWPLGVVAVETGDHDTKELRPAIRRLGRGGESVAREPSVQWCLGRLVQSSPIVTGEVNGGRYDFLEYGRRDRSVEGVEPFDTLMTTLDARRFTGTVQHVFSRIDGAAPASAALEESFELESGTWSTAVQPSVSTIDATW